MYQIQHIADLNISEFVTLNASWHQLLYKKPNSTKQNIIIVSECDICEYDTDNDQIYSLADNDSLHTIYKTAIDQDILYLFCDSRIFRLNLVTKEWMNSIDTVLNFEKLSTSPIFVINNVGHIWKSNRLYMRYCNNWELSDMSYSIGTRWNDTYIGSLSDSQFIYIPFVNQLMVLNEYNDGYIFYRQLNDDNDKEWKLFELRMPYKRASGVNFHVMVLEYAVFVMYYNHNSLKFNIFCVNLLDKNKMWHKSTLQLENQECYYDELEDQNDDNQEESPHEYDNANSEYQWDDYVFNVSYNPKDLFIAPFVTNNEVHFIGKQLYLTASLYDIVPNEARDRDQKLVFGYLRQIENENTIFMSHDLQVMIYQFVPFFC